MTEEERFEQRLAEAMASVTCPFCGADMLDNVCIACGHDPSTRGHVQSG